MKKQFPLALILLLSSFLLHASDKDSDKKDSGKNEFKRFYIGISATPIFGFRYAHKNFVPSGLSDSQVQGVVESTNKRLEPQLGIIAGIKGGIRLTRWLAVETGIQYSQVRYNYNSDYYYNGPVYGGATYTPGDSFRTTEGDRYHYMDIPVSLNFTLGKRTVRGIISVGADLDFLIKKRVSYTYEYSDGHTVSGTYVDRNNNFRTFNVSPFLGLGADFYIKRSFVLRVMPVAEIQTLKNINTPITEYLWNVGLNVSFFIGFLTAGK